MQFIWIWSWWLIIVSYSMYMFNALSLFHNIMLSGGISVKLTTKVSQTRGCTGMKAYLKYSWTQLSRTENNVAQDLWDDGA